MKDEEKQLIFDVEGNDSNEATKHDKYEQYLSTMALVVSDVFIVNLNVRDLTSASRSCIDLLSHTF